MTAKTSPGPRRRTGGRSARVVQSVLNAALAELADVGYARLSMESVAKRAGINKTTLYRRWPTKASLVRFVLQESAGQAITIPDTGSIRQDLMETVQQLVAAMSSPVGRSVMLTLEVESADPELMEIARSLRKKQESLATRVIQRAVDRGELPRGTDAELILITLAGAVRQRLFVQRQSARSDFPRRLVDLVLDGAQVRAGRR